MKSKLSLNGRYHICLYEDWVCTGDFLKCHACYTYGDPICTLPGGIYFEEVEISL
jgi:hypothetical protein